MADKPVAFLFPGQGSQFVGMGLELSTRPEARELFDQADRALGYPLSKLFIEGPEPELRLTANAQPAILAVSVACGRMLREAGIKPAALAGHSLGEYSAHVIAGTLTFDDAVRLVHGRGRYMQEAVPVGEGAMAALLGIDPDSASDLCSEISASGAELVEVANDNARGQIVVAGHSGAVDQVMSAAKGRGAKRSVRLPVSAPFHCQLMQPAQDRLARDLEATSFEDPEAPVICNVDARAVRTAAEAREALVRQVTGRVRWSESVKCLGESGLRVGVELGPGQVLAGLARRIDRLFRVTSAGTPEEIQKAAEFVSQEGQNAGTDA